MSPKHHGAARAAPSCRRLDRPLCYIVQCLQVVLKTILKTILKTRVTVPDGGTNPATPFNPRRHERSTCRVAAPSRRWWQPPSAYLRHRLAHQTTPTTRRASPRPRSNTLLTRSTSRLGPRQANPNFIAQAIGPQGSLSCGIHPRLRTARRAPRFFLPTPSTTTPERLYKWFRMSVGYDD